MEAGNPASSWASAQRWAVAARSPGAWVLAPQAGPWGHDPKVDRLGKEQSLLSTGGQVAASSHQARAGVQGLQAGAVSARRPLPIRKEASATSA